MSLIHGRGTKQFQDFFTPAAASQQLADRIMADWRAVGETDLVVLDPAVGSGSLIWPLLAEWEHGLVVLCCDIQQDYLEAVRAKCLVLGYACESVPTGLRITK